MADPCDICGGNGYVRLPVRPPRAISPMRTTMTDRTPEQEAAWRGLIAPPRASSPGAHRAVSLKWLERVRPTLIDQWPDAISALSIPTTLIRVPDGLIDELFGLHDGKQPGPVMDAFAAELDAAMGWDRKFIRLNSRSPKDWPYPFDVPATCSGKEALAMMAGSERVLDDLYEFSWLPEQPAYVCLRDFVYWIKGWNEFRCFVKSGELIAVTHYDYWKPAPEHVVQRASELRRIIDNYFATKIKPALHIETVVFDVAIDIQQDDRPLLIELNPYGLSDPCWFGSYAEIEKASTDIQCHAPEGVDG